MSRYLSNSHDSLREGFEAKLPFNRGSRFHLMRNRSCAQQCVFLACAVVAGILGAANTFGQTQSVANVREWFEQIGMISNVELEVSRNVFLPDNHPEFSKEPTEMVEVKGALLPQSFYVLLSERAYGKRFAQGESQSEYWSCGEDGVGVTAKSSAAGGGLTNSLARGVLRQRSYLEGWLSLGLIHLDPRTLRLEDTNFSGRTFDGRLLDGRFSTSPDRGLTSFICDEEGGFRLEGTFRRMDLANHKFDAEISLWRQGVHWKTIRIVLRECILATRENQGRIFSPADFTNLITQGSPRTVLQSNGVPYEFQTNGQLRALHSPAPKEEGVGATVRTVILLVFSLSALSLLMLALRRRGRSKEQKGQTNEAD